MAMLLPILALAAVAQPVATVRVTLDRHGPRAAQSAHTPAKEMLARGTR